MSDSRSSFTLRQLLGGLYLIGMISLTASVIAFLQQRLTDYFHQALLENGRTIAQRLAEDGRLSIIQGTSEPIRPRLETVMTYPNVTGIVIATPQGKTVSVLGSYSMVPSSELLASALAEQTRPLDRPDSITIIAPIFERRTTPLDSDPFGSGTLPSSPQPAPQATAAPNAIGFVALTLSKVKLQADLRNLNQHMLVVMWIGILTFTGVLLLVLRQLTRPIKQLAQVMSDPETVRNLRPVEVYGVREAQYIATAFNSLIVKIAEITRELMASNTALTASQASLAQQVEEAVREVKQQNAELVRAREQAEAASRIKSEFMANMSHEIRTPLHGFMGFIDLLAKTPLDHTQQSYLHLLKHSASSLLVVINGILDFSKLEAGKTSLRARPFELEELVRTTVRLFEPNARTKGLKLEIDTEPHLPKTVLGDRQRLAQIIRNLVDNAIKFTEHGGVLVRVGGSPRSDGSFFCHLIVRDTGIGIPLAHHASIFTAFNQVDASTTRQQGGTGLGLAICQQLVELMQGRIDVRSREGAGTEFRVEVPLPIAEMAETAHASWSDPLAFDDDSGRGPPEPLPPLVIETLESERHAAGLPGGPTRVLVVDDNLTNRAYVKLALSSFPTEVVMAESGHAALEACRRHHFDLILMDVRMPGLDGLKTTRRIRRWHANPNHRVPIIGLTADLLHVDRQSWREAGMNDCLFKPLSEERMNQLFMAWGIGQSSAALSAPNFQRTSP